MNRAGFNLTMVLYIITLICLTFGTLSFSSPLTSIQTISLATRTTPYFPDQPPSCPICQQNYDNINSCAQACPVFENFTMVNFVVLGSPTYSPGWGLCVSFYKYRLSLTQGHSSMWSSVLARTPFRAVSINWKWRFLELSTESACSVPPVCWLVGFYCAFMDSTLISHHSFEQTNQTDWLSTPDLPGIVNGMRQVCAIASALLGNVSVVDGQVTPTTAAPTPTASTSNGATQLFLACPAPFVVFVTLLTLGLPLFGFEWAKSAKVLPYLLICVRVFLPSTAHSLLMTLTITTLYDTFYESR